MTRYEDMLAGRNIRGVLIHDYPSANLNLADRRGRSTRWATGQIEIASDLRRALQVNLAHRR